MRGTVLPVRPRRHRSTRRRHDAAPLPRRKVCNRTIGETFTATDGKVFRPSLFVTLTCPSYGRVSSDGVPVDPGAYDYTRAARDALHFAALFDRVHPEPAPVLRVRRAVLRGRRAAAAPRPARPHRNPRHRLPSRAARGARRDLPPGLVAIHPDRHIQRRSPAHLGRDQRHLPRSRQRRSPVDLGRDARRDRRPGPAPTGSAMASNPRTPGPACGRAAARAKPTAASISATAGGGYSSPASGPARRSPITAATARPG